MGVGGGSAEDKKAGGEDGGWDSWQVGHFDWIPLRCGVPGLRLSWLFISNQCGLRPRADACDVDVG